MTPHTDGDSAQLGLLREALAAVLMESLSQPANQPKTRRRAKEKTTRDRAKDQRKKKARGNAGSQERGRDVIGDSVEIETAASQTTRTAHVPIPVPQTDTTSLDSPDSPDNPDDLAEFVDYIAHEVFDALPQELQTLDRDTWTASAALQQRYGSSPNVDKETSEPVDTAASSFDHLTPSRVALLLPALDPSAVDALAGCTGHEPYGAILAPALRSYLAAATTPPPQVLRGEATECEICTRDWVNLTYHHLIPRFVHTKAVKRGWHKPEDLQNVAWLCGACHRAVHRFADHETLAREYYTVERLLAAPEIQKFGQWASRLRWKGR